MIITLTIILTHDNVRPTDWAAYWSTNKTTDWSTFIPTIITANLSANCTTIRPTNQTTDRYMNLLFVKSYLTLLLYHLLLFEH